MTQIQFWICDAISDSPRETEILSVLSQNLILLLNRTGQLHILIIYLRAFLRYYFVISLKVRTLPGSY